MWSPGYPAWTWIWQIDSGFKHDYRLCVSLSQFLLSPAISPSDLTTQAQHFSFANSIPADDTALQKILFRIEFLGTTVGIAIV